MPQETGPTDNPTEATPDHLTLRFKHGKTTVLLFALPTDDFRSVKQELIYALWSTGTSSLSGKPIPTDPDQIELAIPVNKHDLSQGWVGLGGAHEEDEEAMANGAGIRSKRAKGADSTPGFAGLKDGAMLAFRVREEGLGSEEGGEWEVKVASLDDPDVRQDRAVEEEE